MKRVGWVLALSVFAACDGSTSSEDPELNAGSSGATVLDSTSRDWLEEPSPAEWTTEEVASQRSVSGAARVVALAVDRNEGFDRIVVEISGDELPSYEVEYAEGPVQRCGSGENVEVDGSAPIIVRLTPADAHDEAGNSTLRERSLRPLLPSVRDLQLICDFEAVVEWVAGIPTRTPFRVMELADPTRLVIDVSH